jgi:CubicO group peptidase (beta-lactamase class C family)
VPDHLRDVLARVDDWAPETVAVGVTDADATLAAHGPIDAVLPFASVTKPLSAYAVLLAVQHGAVHLDEPAGPKAAEGATVRHLLAHASGLPPDHGGVMTTAPERRRIYSNWGFDVLSDLVAERVGLPFADHLDHEVLHPLGMSATTLDGSAAADARGTVTDLLAFARELLAPTLLDADLHAEATTVAWPELDGVVPGYGRQSPCEWALGFEVKGTKDPHWTGSRLAPSTYGHFGRSGSFLWVDPTRGLAAAELADRDFGSWAIEAWPPFQDAVVAAADAG